MTKLLPCPFCGWSSDPDDLEDVVYPSGTMWREVGGRRTYFSYKERQDGDNFCFVVVCNESMGGCGAEIFGDSEQEAVNKWNRRFS